MSASNSVAERVRLLLAERDLAPGDRLPPERQLAAELSISRASLREGLRRLIDLGILEAHRGSGTYLAAVDLDELLAVRLRLEPYAARLAAARRTDAQLAELDGALRELRATLDDAADFAAADVRVHGIVLDASRSPTLRVLLDALADLLAHSRATTTGDPTVRVATLARHEQLVEALRAGDAVRAERAMGAHLREIRRALARAA